MPVQYPIRAVSKLTGIALDTLRAWERRYQAVTPTRTDRGRLYSEADVRRLMLLRGALDTGRAIGSVASLSDTELEALTVHAKSMVREPGPKPAADPDPRVLQPLIDSLSSCDFASLNEELGRMAVLLPPVALVHNVVLPLMRLAGSEWEKGHFQILQEHMLSACVRNLLGGLIRLPRTGNNGAQILFGTPQGELHEFGILAGAILATSHGFQVAYFGPNLPAGEILLAAGRSAPRAVVLGVMQTNVTPALRADVRRLALELPSSTGLWLGGTGAETALDGLVRPNVLVLDSLTEFERQLFG